MPTSTWKAAERAIAKFFPGAVRRGAEFRGPRGGKSDIIYSGWSIEVKHSKRPQYTLMVKAVEQAERNRDDDNDIPIAVIHKEGQPYKDSLVIIRLEVFQDWYIGNNPVDIP